MARRSRNHDYYLLFYLILNIARIYNSMPYKQPVTGIITFYTIIVFACDLLSNSIYSPTCFIPRSFLRRKVRIGELLKTLFLSSFTHDDYYQILTYLLIFLYRGTVLEVAIGSKAFFILTLFLLIVPKLFYFIIMSLLKKYSSLPPDICHYGMSDLLFGYAVICYHHGLNPFLAMGFSSAFSFFIILDMFFVYLLDTSFNIYVLLSVFLAAEFYIHFHTIYNYLTNSTVPSLIGNINTASIAERLRSMVNTLRNSFSSPPAGRPYENNQYREEAYDDRRHYYHYAGEYPAEDESLRRRHPY